MRLMTIWPKDPGKPATQRVPAFFFRWEDGSYASAEDYWRVREETEKFEYVEGDTIVFSYEVNPLLRN